MPEKRNAKQDTKIAVLQTRLDEVDRKVNKILSNHLPHIERRLGSIERKLAAYAGGIAVLIVVLEWIQRNL